MLQPLLGKFLDGLRGDSNWLQSAAPSSIANWEYYGILMLCIAIIGIVIGAVVLWFVARSSTIGVFVIAVALFDLPPANCQKTAFAS